VGYVVTAEGLFDKQAVSTYLQSKLPEFMIPAIWVELESLPLTPNGKIDRNALPDPDASGLLNNEYIAPRNGLEAAIAAIWQELLGMERVGIKDNFFELGGHSLLAMRVISAIRRELKVEVAIKELFVHPTIAGLAVHLEEHGKGLLLPSIEVVLPRPERIPLSFSQERLWFIDRLEGSVQYHLPVVLKLKGEINKEALSHALQGIVNRHEVLRTVIREEAGDSWQLIREKDQWQLSIADGSKYIADREVLQHYIQQIINKPFDLSHDHMVRAALISLDEEEHVLVVTMHHIASDGWSMSIIVKEVVELYEAYVEVRPEQLSTLQIQYADYAIWQRDYLQGGVLDAKLNYWKKKLEGVSSLQLPADYARPAVQSTRGAIAGFRIDNDISAQLQQLSQQQGTTLFMTLLAVFKVLMHRYSGQQDICVGSPIANREQVELEGLIGFFVNTLALRSEVMGDAAFTELLQQVKTTALEAFANQDLPFEKVVDAVVRERDMSRTPIFQVMFSWQNTPDVPQVRLGDVKLSDQIFTGNTSKFDLTFTITKSPLGLHGSLEYCTDLFSPQRIEGMLAHFKELLKSVVKEPMQKIGELVMLTKAEEQQLLVEFNNTRVVYPGHKNIIDLFEEQVAKTPGATALVFEEEELTYGELNERSNQLAHYLRSKGVREETLVSICIERSSEMLVAILGILKSGKAFLSTFLLCVKGKLSISTHKAGII
jgi:acyl carrier protein